jgi:hypothetical protein
MPLGERFLFRGGAVAFAATIRYPDAVFVNSAGISHLPSIGGLSESQVLPDQPDELRKFVYKQAISFGKAYSSMTGEYQDARQATALTSLDDFGNHLKTNTTANSELDGFTFDVPAPPDGSCKRRLFQSSHLQLSMASTSDRTTAPNSFGSLRAAYEGITLATGDSAPVGLTVHTATEIFAQYDTKEKLIETYSKDPEFRNKYGGCFHTAHPKWWTLGGMIGKHEIPDGSHEIPATFVTGLEWDGGKAPEGTEIHNNCLTISGLGRLYFGEIIIGQNSRRPTLIRSELGSAYGGCLPSIRGEFVVCDMYTGGGGTGGDGSHSGS